MTDPSKDDTVEVPIMIRTLVPCDREIHPAQNVYGDPKCHLCGHPLTSHKTAKVDLAEEYARLTQAWLDKMQAARPPQSWLRRLWGRWWLWWLVGFVTGASLILAVIPGRLL